MLNMRKTQGQEINKTEKTQACPRHGHLQEGKDILNFCIYRNYLERLKMEILNDAYARGPKSFLCNQRSPVRSKAAGRLRFEPDFWLCSKLRSVYGSLGSHTSGPMD